MKTLANISLLILLFAGLACTGNEEKIKESISNSRLDNAVECMKETSGDTQKECFSFLANDLYDENWYGMAAMYYGKINDTAKENLCVRKIVSEIGILPEGKEFRENLPVNNAISISNDLIFVSNSADNKLKTSYLLSEQSFILPINENVFQKIIPTENPAFFLCAVADTIRLIDIYSQRIYKNYISQPSAITDLCLIKNGSSFLSSSWDGTILLWNFASPQPVKKYIGHSACVTSIATCDNGKTFVSGSWDHTIKIWDVESGKCINTIKTQDPIIDISMTRDGSYIYSISKNNDIVKWSARTGSYVETLKGHKNMVKAIETSDDGNYLVSGDFNGAVKVWDSRSSNLLRTIQAHETAVTSIGIAPNSLFFITAGLDHNIKFWCLRERRTVAKSK